MTRVKEPAGAADEQIVAWWGWVLIGWLVLAPAGALLVGRVIRDADRRDLGYVPSADSALGVRRVARRRIPLPPIASVMVVLGVSLEAVGFVLRSAGADRTGARLLSMDAPLSMPRLYIAALFAIAAAVAVIGAARSSGRRTWWLAVAGIATVVALVKSGGTVHVEALRALGVAEHPVLAAVGSAVVLAVVLGSLFLVSRTERRDRRRVIVAFGLYGAASAGLSAVSSLAGADWTAAATFVEESGEVIGAVAVLVAVLVGVAPRLVLPAEWALRRTADAETVDAPGALPTWSPSPRDLRN